MRKRTKAPANKIQLTEGYLRTVRLRDSSFLVWDTYQQGLVVKVRPTGTKTFKVAYRHGGRLRWYTIDRYGAIGLKEAREVARKIRAKAALGEDPQGEKVKARVGDTLKDIHDRYMEMFAREKNKAWQQADKRMKVYILPKLGNRKIKDISRQDIWRIFDDLNDRKVLANAALASASAVFSWAVKRNIINDNPCRGIERHKTTSSARFLSNEEIRAVWPLFDDLGLYPSSILKLILFTAQRPGEVRSMRWEHLNLDAGLWSMPGEPTTGWPGTKNKHDHEVPLLEPVLELLRDLDPKPAGHVFPSTRRGKCISRPPIRPIWEEASIPPFRAHDLRATAATKLDELGVIRQYIALVLNHVEGDRKVTASYVRHDKKQQKKEALTVWTNELLAILDGRGKTDHKAEVIRLDVKQA